MTRDQNAGLVIGLFASATIFANHVALSAMTSVALMPSVLWSQSMTPEAVRPFRTTPWDMPARQFDRSIHRDAVLSNQAVEQFVVKALAPAELNQWNTRRSVVDEQVVSPSLSLPSPGGPSAIPRFIVTIGIDPVERVKFRSWAHVIQEGLEIVSPFGAHADAASSPIVKAEGLWVVTTSLCLTPGLVFTCDSRFAAPSDGGAMRPTVITKRFALQASATPSASVSQCFSIDRFFGAAVAPAEPFGVSSRVERSLDYRQASEAHACQIVKFHKVIIPNRVTPA